MFGKLLGAMIGLGIGLAFQSSIAAFVLAVAGAVLGHRVDLAHEIPEFDDDLISSQFDDEEEEAEPAARLPDSPAPLLPAPSPSLPEPDPRTDLTAAACGVLIELARVDGDVNRDEIAAAREYFEDTLHYSSKSLQRVRNELKAALAQQRDLEPLALTCKSRLDARGRVTFLDAAYQVALADGGLRKSEREALKVLSRSLGITEEAHRELTRAYFGDGAEHYARLGIDPEATDDEVKAAFRRLAAESHPDRFAADGRAAMDAAAEEFRQLQESYEELRRIRNF